MKEQRNEQAVIRAIERAFPAKRSSALTLSLGDDAAVWRGSCGRDTILTCDWFLEGTHFFREKHPPDAVGWKCLARAVSDIAALGGKPSCFLLSLALPQQLTGKWLTDFFRGLRRASHLLGCELAGGDTTRHQRVLISVAVLGEIHPGRAALRSAARPGDFLYASGTLGEAELGLREFRRRRGVPRTTNAALRKHLYPMPRLELGRWLVEKHLASAMMDLSDGLSSDLPRLCAASGVGAVIDVGLLPVTPLASRKQALRLALHGGDDYELLFTVGQRKARVVPKQFRGMKLTCIGEITREHKILLKDESGAITPLRPAGWDPFRSKQSSR